MTEDLDRLDVLAAAATPGPWEARGAFVDTPEHDGAIAETYTTNFDRPGDPYADAAFIAACDPATIRSLVAAVRERDEARLAIDENREAYREQMEIVVRERDELRDVILNGGLRVPGFDHWRERASSKPSDPDDVRWDCSCGYSGSPEKVQKHWAALHREDGA